LEEKFMAKNRYVGGYPVIGIRPIVDGRRGPMMLRESLEPLVWSMAEAALLPAMAATPRRLVWVCSIISVKGGKQIDKPKGSP
jgi:hypothetical protein